MTSKVAPDHESFAKGKELAETVTQWQLKMLLDYWLKVHPMSELPSRGHIDPICMPKALPYISLVEVEKDPFRLRFRLVGTQITKVFSQELTGKYFDEAFPEYESSVGYNQRLKVAESGLPIHYLGQGKLKYNLDFTQVEWILLPLAANGKDVDMIISAISYGGQ